MKKYIAIVVFTFLSLYSYSQELKIFDIHTDIPRFSNVRYSNPISLGLTLSKPDKPLKISIDIIGFSERSINSISYFDSSINRYGYSERPKHQLEVGDSVLTKGQGVTNDGLGIKVGLRRNFSFLGLPMFSSLSVGVMANRSRYNEFNYYTTYYKLTSSTINSIDAYSNNFGGNSLRQTKTTILPQIGGAAGIVLSAGEHLQVIPKINVNFSYANSLGYHPNTGTYSYMTFDFNLSPSVQLSYVLK